MKKNLIIIIILIFLVGVIVILNLNNSTNSYLKEDILNQIMYDYNFLTGNTEEITQQYFNELKTKNNNYSVDNLRKMGIYGNDAYEVILNIQNNYIELTKNLSKAEKEELDKYLLENSLKYYHEN